MLHTHSVGATIHSQRNAQYGGMAISGYEMLKGLAGVRKPHWMCSALKLRTLSRAIPFLFKSREMDSSSMSPSTSHDMPGESTPIREEVEEILHAELVSAKCRHGNAAARYDSVRRGDPADQQAIEEAVRERHAALRALQASLARFNSFKLRGVVPDDLKGWRTPDNPEA